MCRSRSNPSGEEARDGARSYSENLGDARVRWPPQRQASLSVYSLRTILLVCGKLHTTDKLDNWIATLSEAAQAEVIANHIKHGQSDRPTAPRESIIPLATVRTSHPMKTSHVTPRCS